MDTAIQNSYEILFEGLSFLECGSCGDGRETESFRAKNTCYYIEALEQELNTLRRHSSIKHENTFHYALSDHIGKTSFTKTSWGGNSSIEHSQDHRDELIMRGSSFETIEVPCITYPHFIRKIIKKPIDVFVLDIEGGECTVLETMKDLAEYELPKIIAIEAGYNWEMRKALLKELGYEIDFYYVNNVVLSHPYFKLPKRKSVMNEINKQYPEFVWCNKLIFKNDCLEK